MQISKYFGIILPALLFLYSCQEEAKDTPQTTTILPAPAIDSTVPSGAKIADSIMYIATVKNTNPEENTYMDEWLKGAQTDSLTAFIFDAVYAERLKAYDYVTGEVMTLDEVKALEAEYKRENIGQILFTEAWYFDKAKLQMNKQVNSIMLGYFRYDQEGKLLGNKAGIRVYLNGTEPMRAAIDY